MEGNKTKPRALLVFGAPCSGKTTFAEKFARKLSTRLIIVAGISPGSASTILMNQSLIVYIVEENVSRYDGNAFTKAVASFTSQAIRKYSAVPKTA